MRRAALPLSLALMLAGVMPALGARQAVCAVDPIEVPAGSTDLTVTGSGLAPFTVYGIEIRQKEGRQTPDAMRHSDGDGNLEFTFTAVWPPGVPLEAGAATVYVSPLTERGAPKARCAFVVVD